jgi:replication factor C large subunit
VAIEQFPYFEIMFQPEDLARDLADYFDLDDAEVKQFRKRKIKRKKPKRLLRLKVKPKPKTKSEPQSKSSKIAPKKSLKKGSKM